MIKIANLTVHEVTNRRVLVAFNGDEPTWMTWKAMREEIQRRTYWNEYDGWKDEELPDETIPLPGQEQIQ